MPRSPSTVIAASRSSSRRVAMSGYYDSSSSATRVVLATTIIVARLGDASRANRVLPRPAAPTSTTPRGAPGRRIAVTMREAPLPDPSAATPAARPRSTGRNPWSDPVTAGRPSGYLSGSRSVVPLTSLTGSGPRRTDGTPGFRDRHRAPAAGRVRLRDRPDALFRMAGRRGAGGVCWAARGTPRPDGSLAASGRSSRRSPAATRHTNGRRAVSTERSGRTQRSPSNPPATAPG